ncbi:MAG: S1-like domain-containing RNA-binding protein [Duncaniella sp.]|nr:S1-like domain-containing RNA-binding protein [Muribaculum sp.]MCM1255582.1 S1-like domain-containing RNA-binding protein [Duncaniella sp.]
MVKIGKYNKLKVVKLVDFGAYLDGGEGLEILLPAKYIESPLEPGDELDVFIYRDSEERLVATTEHPFAQVGEFAYLQVSAVNRVGAFLDWGLTKQLLVPFSEQTVKLREGMICLVYVYLDDVTKRIVASAKIDKFLGNKYPSYKIGDKVEALVYKHTELGYKTIVDNLYHGLIYESDLYAPLVIEEKIPAYVKRVREDGKIDLTVSGTNDGRIEKLAKAILTHLKKEPGGFLPLSDDSSPESIKATFNCSKRDFKKAIGNLYKKKRILISSAGISLA